MKVISWILVVVAGLLALDVLFEVRTHQKINKLLNSDEWKDESLELSGDKQHEPEFSAGAEGVPA